MKKLLILIFIFCLGYSCYAKTYSLQNTQISLTIEIQDNNLTQITSLKNLKTKQEFLKGVPKNGSLWTFTVKKDRQYSSDPIELNNLNATEVEVNQNKNSLTLFYKQVTAPEITDKFDVICNIELKEDNTYWTIEILGSKEYGIWEVTYPFVRGLYCESGDNFYMPWHGDVFITEFDNEKGFEAPFSDNPEVYTKHFEWQTPVMVQYTSLTKGKTTLYYSPEDTEVVYKNFQINYDNPNEFSVYIAYSPENMGQAGYDYKQKNKLNISLIEGDWWSAAKKYRKWGIENNYAPFSKGLLEKREDVPQWWKELCVCTQGWVQADDITEAIIRTKKEFKDIPVLYQVYGLNGYTYDTHYPKFLPFNEKGLENLKKIKEAGLLIIPYTNGRLADKALNEKVKNAPEKYLVKTDKGENIYEPWAKEAGADNNMACIESEYYNDYLNEVTEMFKTFPFDGLYMDQVGGCVGTPCFDEGHNHPVGGGDYFTKGYNKLLNDLKKNYKSITGENLIITTECGGDAIEFDGWLRCNENGFKSENNKVRSVIFSGYNLNYGSQGLTNKSYEFDNWECYSVINLFATTLTKGYVLGYEGLWKPVFWDLKDISKYTKSAVYARESAKEYFNFGEMVRDVNITSEIPKIHVYWSHFTYEHEVDADTIKTCSFNYKGKTMVCFTNAGKNTATIEWNAKPEDLYLKKKGSYKISQIYPEKNIIKNRTKNIEGETEIAPLETIILIIE